MASATAGSSQYQPPVARIIAPAAATPAAAAASAMVSRSTAATERSFVAVVLILSAEDERAAGHDECGCAAHDEHRQAIHLRYPAGEPVYRCGGDEHLEHKQPA